MLEAYKEDPSSFFKKFEKMKMMKMVNHIMYLIFNADLTDWQDSIKKELDPRNKTGYDIVG